MKTGYSLLLGEYIDAEKVNYLDCKLFQIVCPNCKEPIFKVDRELVSTPVEYLSHYNRDKGYVAECELRVNSLSREEIATSNNLSRGQRLEYFLSVLQETISTTLYPQDETSQTKVNKLLNRVAKSKSLKHYRELMFDYERKTNAKISAPCSKRRRLSRKCLTSTQLGKRKAVRTRLSVCVARTYRELAARRILIILNIARATSPESVFQ